MAQAPNLRGLLHSYFGSKGIDRIEQECGIEPNKLHYWVRKGAVNRVPDAKTIKMLSDKLGIPETVMSAALISDAGINLGDGVTSEEMRILRMFRDIPMNQRRTIISLIESYHSQHTKNNTDGELALG